jgi:hypothetical protein
MNLEYLRINIEDNSTVPIKLSFPVAFQFIEGAFTESTLIRKDKSHRNNALVDDYCVTLANKTLHKNKLANAHQLNMSLAPIEVDFSTGEVERKT